MKEVNTMNFIKEANFLIREKRYDEAIACYDKALETNPKNAEVLVNKAEVLIQIHDTEGAKEICNSLKSRSDLKEQDYSELMNLYSKLNDYKSVDEVFEKSPKSDEIKNTYIKILKINVELNILRRQRMQTELDEANRNSNYEKAIKDMEKNIIDEIQKFLTETILEEAEKTRVITQKINDIQNTAEVDLSKIDSVDEKTYDKLDEIADKMEQYIHYFKSKYPEKYN